MNEEWVRSSRAEKLGIMRLVEVGVISRRNASKIIDLYNIIEDTIDTLIEQYGDDSNIKVLANRVREYVRILVRTIIQSIEITA